MVSWKQWSEPGEWGATITGVGHKGRLYTVERDGSLYKTGARSGRSEKLDSGYDTRFLVSDGDILVAIEKSGALYTIDPAEGSWVQLGEGNEWGNTVAADAMGGSLFTVEASGTLYHTDLETGEWEELGDGFDTRYLWAWAGYVYILENDGTLYKVDPESGEYEQFGDSGAYANTTAATIHDGTLYTIEDGKLGATDIDDGAFEELSGPEYGNTRHLFGAADALYSIETDGTLYKIDLD